MGEHTARSFDADIDLLRSNVLKMGGLVERQVQRAVDGIRLMDLGLVAEVLADEEVVNRLHVQTDLMCNRVIAKRQPIAIDLREIIAILHMINDLERVGDEAKKVALKVRRLGGKSLPVPVQPISAMAADACDMLRLALDAFVRHDTGIAQTLTERDRNLDSQRDAIVADLLANMATAPATIGTAMDLVLVVQSLERVGDHAKNVAEYVVNVVEGVDSRHDAIASRAP
ncbi:MAG: phosphate signaling complex protein PhoU [Burkholderiaceae bacterium]|nr:phosphate signaling complex protein PhoU [Burkholderiaceae bacterium]